MIHLYSLVNRLEKTVRDLGKVSDIASITAEIIAACDRLIVEHGRQKDIITGLSFIKTQAELIKGLSYKIFNYPGNTKMALGQISQMKDELEVMGAMLRIEFKEIES